MEISSLILVEIREDLGKGVSREGASKEANRRVTLVDKDRGSSPRKLTWQPVRIISKLILFR